MAAEIPTIEPEKITAGTTAAWTKTLDDFPASSWTLTYYFRGTPGGFQITATADGDDFLIEATPSTTAAFSAGDYKWIARVSSSSQAFDIASGLLTVYADPIASPAGYETRTHAAQVLARIEETILRSAGKDEQSIQFDDGRMIQYVSKADLIRMRALYKAEVEQEKASARIAQGLGSGNRILIHFRNAS